MAFDPRLLSPLFYSNGSTVWLYRSGADALAAIGAGYFDAAARRLRASDWIMVAAPDGASALAVTSTGASVSFVAALSGTAPVPAPVITVNTPAGQSGAAPFTVSVSGSYGGGNAGAVEVATSIDGGTSWSGWSTLVAAPGGGTYAGSVVFAAGGTSCRVRTRMTGAPGIIAVSAAFALATVSVPTGPNETTAINGTGGTGASAAAGGAANNELTLNAPFVGLRADDPTRVTTAGGAVSQWAGIVGTSVPATQGAAANRPAHDQAGGFLRFASTAAADADGDWLDIPALGTRFQSGQSDSGATRLGIAYQLFRLPALPGYDTMLHRVGTNNASFIYPSRRSHILGIYGGVLRVMRGDATSAAQADAGPCPVNEWIAVAHVFNDDRTTAGTSDNVSRIFAKTKAGGSWATMVSASSAAKQVVYHPSTLASINRARYAGATSDSSANMDVAAFYFDTQPPRGNAEIEANLDKLLARV